MKKVILITGASTGIGNATALYFAKKGWDVSATMRNPAARKTGLEGVEGISIRHMDVTDLDSIKTAIAETLSQYGKIDAVFNNAGYAVIGPFEAISREDMLKEFGTNVTGLMDVCREIIPLFREQNSGTIINVASIAGKVGFPYYSLYNSTKFAVEGFSEDLSYELNRFNIKVRLIEPGIILTDFYNRSMVISSKAGLPDYDKSFEKVKKATDSMLVMGSKPQAAAKVIYKAATSKGGRLRFTAGADAAVLLALRKLLPDWIFIPVLKKLMSV
jgi:NAD(P)-dependent dehydrogenase (short-subunit alcohol dehydrogenase family)